MTSPFKFKATIRLYDGPAPWHFAGLPKTLSAQLKEDFAGHGHGFGSIRVTVTLGKTVWKTSIFPDSKSGTYLLPLKAEVRKKEGVKAGDSRQFQNRRKME